MHNGEVTDLAARLARQDPIDSVRLAALQLLRGQEAAEAVDLGAMFKYLVPTFDTLNFR